MLSDKEKKEMLSDAFDRKRHQEFLEAERRRPKGPRTLDDYIAFLMDVQKIKPFAHERHITASDKNIL